jgi:ankyrin repeat protein
MGLSMKTKPAFGLIGTMLLMMVLGKLDYLERSSAIVHFASPQESVSANIVVPNPGEFMKPERTKLTPLLGSDFMMKDFAHGDAAVRITRPNELFSVWRQLPEFSTWDDLTLASMLGDTPRARDLLDHGADPNGNSGLDTTPLIEALKHDHVDIAELLLAKTADGSRRTPNGWTALHFASSNGWTSLARLILSQNVDLNSTTENGWTPLIIASRRKHADVVKLLLNHGADPEIYDADGATALLYATTGGEEESGGDFDCVSTLIEHGANVNISDARGWTPLMGAAFYGDLRSVRLLVEHGAEVSAENKNGETARSLAETNKQWQVVEFLAP